jgi:hypothetical protein
MPFALNSPACRRTRTLHWLVLLASFALLTPALRAQVVFQKEVEGMAAHAPLLHVSNAPFDLSDPLYDSTTTHKPWMVASQNYYTIDLENGVVSNPEFFPPSVRMTTDAHISFAGRNTSTAIAFVLGFRKTLYVVNISGPTPVVVGPVDGVPVPVGQVSSMAAADRTHLTMIADGWFWSINIANGTPTPQFMIGDDLPGGHPNLVLVNDPITGLPVNDPSDDLPVYSLGENTRYHAYGPNGLLYVLDYDHNRMLMMDPNLSDPDTVDQFRLVHEFSFQTGVTVENMSFAIGINGNIYLGDGAGGGSTYSATGDFLGVFTPSITPSPGLGGAGGSPHIDTDAVGNVYVYDEISGYPGLSQFQYRDLSAVPEPTTSAMIVGAGAAFLARSRRLRSRSRASVSESLGASTHTKKAGRQKDARP